MKIYSADLETTVYEGQDHTEAWASALVPLDSDKPLVFHSLDDTLDYLDYQDEDAVLYYHNLKFDGNFWLSFLLTQKQFKQGIEYISPTEVTFKEKKEKSYTPYHQWVNGTPYNSNTIPTYTLSKTA